MDVRTSPLETEQPAPDYSVTGTRIIAAIIDMAVITALFVIMALALGDTGSTGDASGNKSFHIYLQNGPFLVFLAASFVYFFLLEGLFGATLGKIVMGLQVVDVEDGSRCSWPAALIRNLVRIVDGLPVFYLVGLIAVAVNKKRQRLGDLAAKTLVVRAR